MSTNIFLTLASGVVRRVQAIAASAGAADANKIIATGSDGRIHTSLMPTGIGAQTETIVASEALAAGDFVNIWMNASVRSVRKADASNGREANGFVLTAVASAANATVFLQGANTALTGLTPGTRMFLSATTSGQATATAPNTAGQSCQFLGFVASSTSIQYEYDRPVALDA